MTRVVDAADPAALDAIGAALEDGAVVVLPTDTVYGVAARPTDGDAVEALFALKGRGADVPLAVLCADAGQALALAVPEAAAEAEAAAERWWPGPLTLVLPRRRGLALHLGEPVGTVGVRVPAHPLVQAVARRVGPIATTSANRHGQPVATTAAQAAAELGAGVALVVDGGAIEGRSSTVIDTTSVPWRTLRPGPIEASLVPGFEARH